MKPDADDEKTPHDISTESPDTTNTDGSKSSEPTNSTTKTPESTSKHANERTQSVATPRAQIISRSHDEPPNSASSAYSIHIPELGARRREKTLADFKILKKMGEGAYGKVVLAEYISDPHYKWF